MHVYIPDRNELRGRKGEKETGADYIRVLTRANQIRASLWLADD